MNETIDWKSAEYPPEDELPVLLFDTRRAFPGYRDGDTWRAFGGMIIGSVSLWAYMPVGPSAGCADAGDE
jgi:hypothetical protein